MQRPEGYVKKGFDSVKGEYIDYFRSHTFDAPILMSFDTAEELRMLGIGIYKSIHHILLNYEKYLHLIPRSDKELNIFEICKKHPYNIGTFRADFVIDESNGIHIIEMNAKKPFNGLFISAFFNEIAFEQAKRLNINHIHDYFTPYFDYVESYIGDNNHIAVVHGNEPRGDLKYYPSIFNAAGVDCHLIPVSELRAKINLLQNAKVIMELSGDEMMRLNDDEVEILAQSTPHNAMFAVFHSGSKRFLKAITDKKFLSEAVLPHEQELILKYFLPSYSTECDAAIWEDAFKNKDGYIMKHHFKARSEQIYAGSLMNEGAWKRLFDVENKGDMILQSFIRQRTFEGSIGNEKRKDFATGTLLYVNDQFFGPGVYRTHVSPVASGTGDFKKIAQLVTSDSEFLDGAL